MNILAKPPKYKAKIIPQPKSKRIQHDINDDNKENICHKNTKNIQSNRQFGKDITNSVSNIIAKRNSFNSQRDSSTKTNVFIKKNSSASQLNNKNKNVNSKPQHISMSKKENLSVEKNFQNSITTSLASISNNFHIINSNNNNNNNTLMKNNSSRINTNTGSNNGLRNSVTVMNNINYHHSFGKPRIHKDNNTTYSSLVVSHGKETEIKDINNNRNQITQIIVNVNNNNNKILKDTNIHLDPPHKLISVNTKSTEQLINRHNSYIAKSSQNDNHHIISPQSTNPNFNLNIHNSIPNTEKFNNEKYFQIQSTSNIQIPWEYINSIYHNLLKEEQNGIFPKPEYNYMCNQNEINQQMRSILVDWLIEVHHKFGFTDETLYMTVFIIDRFLTIEQITRSTLQLLGITALMISCKHEEIDLPKVDDFIYITDNAYTRDEVFSMEKKVLNRLNFSLLYPSPIKFFELLANGFNFNNKQLMMGKYLMESFLIDLKNIKYKGSVIACATAYVVMKFFKVSNYQESYNRKYYCLIKDSENNGDNVVKECAKDICLFVDNIHKTNFKSTQKKFSKSKYEKVALLILGK